MASTIKLKNGSGAPLAGDLVQGEPALDLTNKRLYTEDSLGNVIEVGTNPSSLTTGNITSSGTVSVDTIAEKTAANGVVVDGVTLKDGGITVTADVVFGDSDKAVFGAGSDLQIYHDGSNSYVDDFGTGNLVVRGSAGVFIQAQGTSDNMGSFVKGGASKLFYDGSEKIATTATGIDVTGTVTADGLTVNTSQGDVSIVTSASSLNFARAGTSYIRATDVSGSIHFTTGANNFANTRLRLAENGDISFYEDTGTTAKFFWDASAESLGIGTTSPAAKLHSVTNGAEGLRISHTTTGSFVSSKFVNDLAEGLNLTNYGSTYSAGSVLGVGAGGVALNNTNDLAINVSTGKTIRFGIGNTEAARLDSSGNVGIGTTSPQSNLELRADLPRLTISDGRNKADWLTDDVIGELAFYSYDGSGIGARDVAYVNCVTGRSGTTVSGELAFGISEYNETVVEAMRIDRYGNLLVGKTSAGSSNVGVESRPAGHLFATGDGISPLRINRLTSDGALIEFQKDSALRAKIGLKNNNPYIDNGTNSIQFNSTDIRPRTADAGSNLDATVNLGEANARFKDLYLSGGVVFGSAGGAVTSKTLDDYEEGTWTPEVAGTTTAGTATYLSRTARYTKIGNRVTFTCFVAYSSLTGTGNLLITGLPFTCAEGFSPVCAVKPVSLTFSGQLSAAIGNATTQIRIEYFSSGTTGGSVAVDTDAYLYVSGHYITS